VNELVPDCAMSQNMLFPGNVHISSPAKTTFLPFIPVLSAKQKSVVTFYLNRLQIPQLHTKQTREPG